MLELDDLDDLGDLDGGPQTELPVQALLETEYEHLITEDDLARGFVPIGELAQRVADDDAAGEQGLVTVDEFELDETRENDEDDNEDDVPARTKSPPLFRLAAIASIVVALLLLLDRWAQPPKPSPPPPNPGPPVPSGESRSWAVLVNPIGYHLDDELVTAPPQTAADFLTAIKAKAGDEILIDTTNAPANLVNALLAAAQQRGMFLRIL